MVLWSAVAGAAPRLHASLASKKKRSAQLGFFLRLLLSQQTTCLQAAESVCRSKLLMDICSMKGCGRRKPWRWKLKQLWLMKQLCSPDDSERGDAEQRLETELVCATLLVSLSQVTMYDD